MKRESMSQTVTENLKGFLLAGLIYGISAKFFIVFFVSILSIQLLAKLESKF